MRRHLLVFLTFVTVAAGQVPTPTPLSYYLPPGIAVDPSVPTPESFFGFQVGDWHLQPDQLHAYIRLLAERSDRITVETMGETYEHRPILLAIVTSPENHKSLARIKEEHARLSDPAASASLDISKMPVVVWMGYSIHGNEPSGSNAAAMVAYVLAAARGPEIDEWLSNAVILLNPSINPDGLNRFATWVNANRGAVLVKAGESREHNEPWPSGRSNHYWFDLNRDWLPVQHPETRARLMKYYEWRPNLLTDHHEMGSTGTFFFQPGIPSGSNPLAPKNVGDLTVRLSKFHAQALNATGALYYTRESFDDFYVGKGSSYPDITGGVGILFEQASSRGHVVDVPGGPLTFQYAIRNQITASFSSIRGAVALRQDFLQHQREFSSSTFSLADQSPVKGYAFGSSSDPAKVSHLLDILARHQIQVHRLARAVKDDKGTITPDGGYVVPVRQPQFRLLTSLFEKRTRFDDSLFYDVSAWNLPAAFNLPIVELGALGPDLLGERVSGTVRNIRAPIDTVNVYAYIIDWTPYYAPRTLTRLHSRGIQVRASLRPVIVETSKGPVTFGAGALVVPVRFQNEKRDAIITALNEAVDFDACRLQKVSTGLAERGIDLGSPNLVVLPIPSVALLAGAGASSSDAGEIWHLLDQRFSMPVVLLDPSSLGRADISRLNVIIMAAGSLGTIDSIGRIALLRWVERGNTMIATEQAVEWAIANKFVSATLRRRAEEKSDSSSRRVYGEEDAYRGARMVPGSIVEAVFDSTHPLVFGFSGSRMTMFKSTSLVLEVPKASTTQPVFFTATPLVSGYLHPETFRMIQRGGAVQVNSLQAGRIILMTDNPAFRAYWFGTNRLILNGIFFGSMIRSSSGREDE